MTFVPILSAELIRLRDGAAGAELNSAYFSVRAVGSEVEVFAAAKNMAAADLVHLVTRLVANVVVALLPLQALDAR